MSSAAPTNWPAVGVVLRDSARGTVTIVGSATARNEQLLDTSLATYIRKCLAYLQEKGDKTSPETGLPEVLFEVALRNMSGWCELLSKIEPHIVKVTLDGCVAIRDVAGTLERLPNLKEVEIRGGHLCIDQFLQAFTPENYGQGQGDVSTPRRRALSIGKRFSRGGGKGTPPGMITPLDLRVLTLGECTLQQLEVIKSSPMLRDNLVGLHLLSLPMRAIKLTLTSFPRLSEFSLGAREGQLVEADITGCPTLTHLDLSPNVGTKVVTVHALPELTLLTLSSALLALTIRDCPRLARFALQDMPPPLRHVKFVNLPNFTPINLSGCPTLETMTLLGALRMDELKLQHCPVLERLEVGGADSTLQAAVLNNCPALKMLSFMAGAPSPSAPSCPKLARLDVQNCEDLVAIGLPIGAPALRTVRLQQLPALQALPPLSRCPALREVAVADAGMLRAFKVVGCDALQEVTLWQCAQLRELGLGKMPGLTGVAVADCAALETITLAECGPLSKLGLMAVPVLRDLIVSGCTKLTALDLRPLGPHGKPSQKLSVLKAYNCSALAKVLLPTPLPELTHVEFINVNQLQLPNLAACPTLRILTIGGCKSLTGLDLHDNDSLLELNLRANPTLGSLTLGGCNALEALDLSGNPALAAVKVEACNSLKQLTVGDNPSLKTLALRSLAALMHLDLATSKEEGKAPGGMSLVKLQVGSCPELASIQLPQGAPKLEVVRLTDLPALRDGPNIASCPMLQDVTAMGLKELPALKIVGCPNLAVVDVRSCPALQELDLTGAKGLQVYESFDLEEVPELTKVVLAQCSQLKEVPPMIWDKVPKLTHLDVSGCPHVERLNWNPAGPRPLLNNPDDLEEVDEAIDEPATPRTERRAEKEAKARRKEKRRQAKEREAWRDLEIVLDPDQFDRLDEHGVIQPPKPQVQASSLEDWLRAQLARPYAEQEGRVFGIHGDAWAAMSSSEKLRLTALLDKAGFRHQFEKELLEYAARCTARAYSRGNSRSNSISGSLAGSLAGSRAGSAPNSRPTSRPPSRPGSRPGSRPVSRAASPARRLADTMGGDDDEDDEDDITTDESTSSSDSSDSEAEAGRGGARGRPGAPNGAAAIKTKPKKVHKPINPPVLFRHHQYGAGCHGPVPASGQTGKRVAGTAELEDDMDSCGAGCRGARSADGANVQLITHIAEPVIRPLKVTTRHHARCDVSVSFPQIVLERRWGPFRAAPYPSTFTATANVGICRHSESSICILVPRISLGVHMNQEAMAAAAAMGTKNAPLLPRAVALQVEPARRVGGDGVDPLTMVLAEMKPMQAYALQPVAAPAAPAVKGAPTAEVSVSSPRSPMVHAPTRSSILKAQAAAANSPRKVDSPRRGAGANTSTVDSPRRAAARAPAVDSPGKAAVPRVASLRKTRPDAPQPPSTNAKISTQLRLRSPIQPTSAAATYEVALDGASSLAPAEWEGNFNTLTLKAFESHSHWKPLFSSWDGGNWKKGVVKVRMVMQLQGCRMVHEDCPLLHKRTQQPLAFTSYLEPARLHGRDATIVAGPIDVTFRF